jgi:phosphoglycerate dehydrogenase-like enzyme
VGNYCAAEVAEHAFALAVALVRKLPAGHALVREGIWDRTRVVPVRRLGSQVLGIVGVGAIGSALADRWTAIGGRVIYFDPHRPDYAGPGEARDLDELLSELDVLSLHVPLTPETRGLIATRELSLMRDGAIVINTSRGEVVDNDALRSAVANGRLGGVGLDVWDPEPMPADEFLLSSPNALVTPHYAGYSEESFDELRQRVLQQVLEVQRGEVPTWTLNGVVALRAGA